MKNQNTIKIHSVTDLITNSSTTIYTISNASIQASIDMINSILQTFDINTKAEDLFSIFVLLEDDYSYIDAGSDKEGLTEKEVKKILKDLKEGKIEKPEWMNSLDDVDTSDEYVPSTTLYIVPKNPKYADMAQKIVKFLYSTKSGECMC